MRFMRRMGTKRMNINSMRKLSRGYECVVSMYGCTQLSIYSTDPIIITTVDVIDSQGLWWPTAVSYKKYDYVKYSI